jgi:hypothetical protein
MESKDSNHQTSPEIAPEAVREQLERILKSPLFLNSRRYPCFLRHIVTYTLEGKTEQLKERSLGMEVFGRDPDYDTNLDNVVRITAGEIRKRLAQYYQEVGHGGEIRIDLPSGSYVPRFHLHVEEPAPVLSAPKNAHPGRLWGIIAAALALVTIAIFAWTRVHTAESALDKFWAPVLNSGDSVIMCIGTTWSGQRQVEQMNSSGASATSSNFIRSITIGDAVALTKFVSLLDSRGKTYHLRGDFAVTLTDLEEAPVILIGGMNNDWTLRLVASLHFSLQTDTEESAVWIADGDHPSRKTWCRINSNIAPENITEDYALISRFRSPMTGQFTVTSSGLYRYGTAAAAAFLTDPSLLAEFAAMAPVGWEKQNVQVVINTKMINGKPSRPTILSTYFW